MLDGVQKETADSTFGGYHPANRCGVSTDNLLHAYGHDDYPGRNRATTSRSAVLRSNRRGADSRLTRQSGANFLQKNRGLNGGAAEGAKALRQRERYSQSGLRGCRRAFSGGDGSGKKEWYRSYLAGHGAETLAQQFYKDSLPVSIGLHLFLVGMLFLFVSGTPIVEELNDPRITKISFAKIEKHTPEPQVGDVVEQKVEKKKEVVKPAPKSRPVVKNTANPTPPPAQPVVTEETVTRAMIGMPDAAGTEVGADYRKQVAAWLARHKRYPERARRRGVTGDAVVSLSLDRSGAVISSNLIRSTQSELLDGEVSQMIARANPFPAPPLNYGTGSKRRQTLARLRRSPSKATARAVILPELK
jgi:TonB family protein